MMRDITQYADTYAALPFEPVQASYRRKAVLAQINKYHPKSLIEVGCGQNPLFTDLPNDMEITVIEPSVDFANHAKTLAAGRNVHIHQSFLEDDTDTPRNVDMIIVSSLLHEVSDTGRFLRVLRSLCGWDTIVHLNVPNRKSVHRLLGTMLGIKGPSSTQKKLQQSGVIYDFETLQKELNLNGFNVFDRGGYFMKPLTHAQMQKLMDDGLLTSPLLNLLDRMAVAMPNYASEIWVNMKRSS